jgi:hypothetical protein
VFLPDLKKWGNSGGRGPAGPSNGGSKATPGEPCQIFVDGELWLIPKLESCDNIVQDISGGNLSKQSSPASSSTPIIGTGCVGEEQEHDDIETTGSNEFPTPLSYISAYLPH